MERVLLAILLAGCSGSSAAPDVMPDLGPEPTPPAGVVAWFPMNNQLADSTGTFQMVFAGPLSNAFGEGYHNGGGYLDGIIQRELVSAPPLGPSRLDFAGPFSVGMWIRVETVPAEFGVIASRSYGSATDSSFALVVDSAMRLRYDSQNGASLAGTTALALDQWTHVALTYDGTTKRIYVGGALDASGPAAGPVMWDHEYISFGGDEGQTAEKGNHFLTGSIDDITLFDRAVTDAEWAAFVVQ